MSTHKRKFDAAEAEKARETQRKYERLARCPIHDLHEFLQTRPLEFDIDALLQLFDTGHATTLLYWAITDVDAERVALLLLLGANPHAPVMLQQHDEATRYYHTLEPEIGAVSYIQILLDAHVDAQPAHSAAQLRQHHHAAELCLRPRVGVLRHLARSAQQCKARSHHAVPCSA